MKQIQPKRIANPSNFGEEIAAKVYNKDFLLESIMYSSDADYIVGVTARVKIVQMTILMHQYSC